MAQMFYPHLMYTLKKEKLKNYENEKSQILYKFFRVRKKISASLSFQKKHGAKPDCRIICERQENTEFERVFFITWRKLYQTPEYHTNTSMIASYRWTSWDYFNLMTSDWVAGDCKDILMYIYICKQWRLLTMRQMKIRFSVSLGRMPGSKWNVTSLVQESSN